MLYEQIISNVFTITLKSSGMQLKLVFWVQNMYSLFCIVVKMEQTVIG